MAATQQATPWRGDVILVDLDPMTGHEQGRRRPGLVVSDDSPDRSPAGLVIVPPIAGTDRGIPAHVRVPPGEGGLAKPSVIMADQVRTISRRRINGRLGAVSPATMGHVETRPRLALGLT